MKIVEVENVVGVVGIDFKIKTVELRGKKIKLQIWDTAGQERFHTITTSYYRGAMGIMLVYDITNEKSFENIVKWLRNIDEVSFCSPSQKLVSNSVNLNRKWLIRNLTVIIIVISETNSFKFIFL